MTEWAHVYASEDLLPGETTVIWAGDTPVLVLNLDGVIYALEDRCSHEDFELSAGAFDAGDGTIECALHGARFDVRSGRPVCPPAYTPVRTFPARLAEGSIWVAVAPQEA